MKQATGRILILTLLCGALMACAENRTGRPASDVGRTYYLDSHGNDRNSGRSPSLAWQTIARLNEAVLQPGDHVAFTGGQVFEGQIVLDEHDRGTASHPVILTSGNRMRATIRSGTGNGLLAYETAGIRIENLNFRGSGRVSNDGTGISFYTERKEHQKLNHVVISAVSVSGYKNGITIGGWNGSAGYQDVTIANARVHNTEVVGILIFGKDMYSNMAIRITGAHVSHVSGASGASRNTGNGIVLGSVDTGLIEESTVYENGWRHDLASEGPVGIWAFDSRNITIQNNSSFRNRTGSKTDGGGFDLDRNVTDSILQFNRSYSNDGAGYMLYQKPGTLGNSGNIVRFNVSQNDGGKNGFAGLHVFGPVSNAVFHDNVVISRPSLLKTSYAIRIQESGKKGLRMISNVLFRNNFLFACNQIPVIRIDQPHSAGQLRLVSNTLARKCFSKAFEN